MKSNLPVLNVAFTWTVALTGMAFAHLAVADPAALPSNAIAATRSDSGLAAPPNGDDWMRQVLAAASRQGSITARVRQRVSTNGAELFGAGKYWQQGLGEEIKVCLILQLQVAEQTATLRQVSNGRLLWTDRELAGHQQVVRLDLRRIRRAAAAHFHNTVAPLPGMATATQSTPANALIAGGIPQLLAALIENFTFESPLVVTVGDRSFVTTIGRWRPERFAKLWPSAADTDEQTPSSEPEHLPSEVMLRIDRDELLPVVIEYRSRSTPSVAPAATALDKRRYALATRPLVRVEFTEVRTNVPIAPVRFHYAPPADVKWTDGTQRMLQRIEARAASVAARPQ